jgi:hypothetical protein
MRGVLQGDAMGARTARAAASSEGCCIERGLSRQSGTAVTGRSGALWAIGKMRFSQKIIFTAGLCGRADDGEGMCGIAVGRNGG